jgi:MFS family permease
MRPSASIAGASAVASAAILGCASSGSVWEFALFYFAFGTALAFFWPMMMGWLSSGSEGGELGRRQGIYNMSWCLGIAVGPYLAGKLSEMDLEAPLHAAAAVFALVSLPMGWIALRGGGGRSVPPEDAVDAGVDDDPAAAPDADSGSVPAENAATIRYLAWVGLFSAYFANGASWNVLPLYLNEILDFSKPVVGALFLTRSLAMTAAFYLWGKTVFWHGKTYPLVIAQTALAATVLALIPARGVFAIATLLAVFGALSAFCYSSAIFHGVAGAADKARRVGTHEAILAASAVTGSIVSGLLYQEFSMAAVFAGCAGLCLLAAAAQTAGALPTRGKKQRPRM